MNKYLLIAIAVILIAAGWWYISNSSTYPSASKPGWIVTTSQQLGVRFENPADASVSVVEQRQTIDGTTVNTIAVTPRGTDATIVHFFTTNVSLEHAKNIQFYRSDISNSEFVDTTIDGVKGLQRIDHFSHNECTDELTVAEKNGKIYGFHIVQCPTHPAGYDQLRSDIANSLEIL